MDCPYKYDLPPQSQPEVLQFRRQFLPLDLAPQIQRLLPRRQARTSKTGAGAGAPAPADARSKLLQTIADLNPFSYAVDAARALIAGQLGDSAIILAFALMAAFAALTLLWVTRVFRRATA